MPSDQPGRPVTDHRSPVQKWLDLQRLAERDQRHAYSFDRYDQGLESTAGSPWRTDDDNDNDEQEDDR